jgi:PPM family protein phosphatase
LEEELQPPAACAFEASVVSDVGTEREHNEDQCACFVESATAGIVAVADGVSSFPAGETASKTAIEAAVRSYRQLAGMPLPRRLPRAVQQANIDVYDLGVVVPELRGMATTLTAVAIEDGALTAAHVGDCRLYLCRAGRITQLTKDHTVTGERVRMGLMSEQRARNHRDRSTLTRCLGRELIVAIDRIGAPLRQGDTLILCSDGLYNVVAEPEMLEIVRGQPAATASRALVAAANQRGTPDNVSAAVINMIGATPAPRPRRGVLKHLARWIGLDA